MRVVIAPDSFKGSLDARSAAAAIAEGVRRVARRAELVVKPMADGGEGTLDILVDAGGGVRRSVRATGPLGEPVEGPVGLVRHATAAVIEAASFAGYALVPPERRDPLKTTTYGIGRAIRAAIETGVEEVVLCLGGSATVDGGAGLMQALGLKLMDDAGRRLPAGVGGGDLARIRYLAWDETPEWSEQLRFTVACDVLNPVCGPNGAARVFGPQKGADAAAVAKLEQGLSHWADLLEQTSGRRVRNEPGTGAAGGIALPLLALANASVTPGVDLVIEANGLANEIDGAELMITGEGRLDRQSMMGKVVGTVGRLARSAHVSCVAIVGATGEGVEACEMVLDRYYTLDCPLEETRERLVETAARVATELL